MGIIRRSQVRIQTALTDRLLEKDGHRFAFFCPQCRAPRKLPFRPKPESWSSFLRVGAFTAAMVLIFWHWMGAKGVVCALPAWAAYEVFYRTRCRAYLTCGHCGFNPYLYLIDAKQARAGMEAHFRRLFEEKGLPYPTKPGAEPGRSPVNDRVS